MANSGPTIFSLDGGNEFAARVAAGLGVTPARHEERDFGDGEHKIRPLDTVRGRDVFVVQSLGGEPDRSVNDQLVRLLFLLGALRDNGARRLTAVVPYLCYSRKDRRTKRGDPVTTRYVAQLFEAVGVDAVVTLDVHNRAAFENAFRCRTEHLSARGPLMDHLLPALQGRELTVASPDVGGVKRAELFRAVLEQRLGRPVGSAFMEKYRSKGEVSGATAVGQLRGRTVVVVDDLIAGGGTLQRAAAAFRREGAVCVHALATHGLFTGELETTLADTDIQRLVVTNSVPPWRLPGSFDSERMEVVDVAPLIADAIGRMYRGEELSDLEA